jgi:electron transfer flavoprotein alpha subunit/NAD-dependent dihydropyrimidine dehydrogenase PreA subunit
MQIIHEKCNYCTQCIDSCAYDALSAKDGKISILEHCISCAACIEVCESQAIVHDLPARSMISDSSSGVWVYAEQHVGLPRKISYELLGEGRRLANQLGVELSAVYLGSQPFDSTNISPVKELIAYGADKVYLVNDPYLDRFNDIAHARVLTDLIREHQPEIVLIGATTYGRSLAPRVAASLGTGLTADCTRLEIDEVRRLLLQTRPAFGGNLMATIVCPYRRPQMATVRSRVMKPSVRDDGRRGEIIQVNIPSYETNGLDILQSILSTKGKESLIEAEVIVSVGKGIGDLVNFGYVERLANLLGASIGASRSLVDEGFVDYTHQIGQTGKTVAPRVYIACGISGAVQHIAGMSTAEFIIAINSDPDAPIFRIAHVGIVANLTEFLPALVAALECKN